MTIKLESVQQAMAMARSYAKKGDTVHARRIYQAVLARYPNNARAAKELEKLQKKAVPFQKGKRATDPSRDEIEQFKKLLEMKENEKALAFVTALKRKYPKAAVVLNMTGTVLVALGRFEEAIEALKRAQSLLPNDTEIINNLAGAYFEAEQYGKAFDTYSAALRLRPGYVRALSNRARVCLKAGRYAQAIEDAENSLALAPGDISTEFILGEAYAKHFELDKALACFDRILAVRPDLMPARIDRAGALVSLGRLDEARIAYEEILEADPTQVNVHFAISKLKKYTADDPHIAQMHRIADRDDLDPSSRAQLYFALATIHDKLGDTATAFDCYLKGNKVRHDENAYVFDTDIKRFQRLKDYFRGNPLPALAPLPESAGKRKPIFIVGMPRSGTTLTEQIISSHSQVHGAGELTAMGAVVGKWFNNDREPVVGAEVRTMLKHIRRTYLDDEHVASAPLPYVTDKMPMNFLNIGFMVAAFPDAPIIHLRRDPMAVCWSNYRQLFRAKGLKYAYDLETLGRYYRLYEDLMEFWHQQYPGRIYDLSYDALTQNQEEETRKLIAHCGLDWEDACLDFHKNKRSISTASATQVRQKMYKGSSQAWMKYKDHLAPLQVALAGPVPQ